MSTLQQKIDFRQSRDFGELFNATIKFLRQNFKPLFKSLLFIAGPFIIVSAIAAAFYQSNMFSFSSLVRNSNMLSNIFTPAYFILIFFSILGSLVLMGVVYEYMLLYAEKGPGQVTPADVGRKLLADAWKIISTFLVLFFIGVVFIIFIALIIGGIGAGVPGLAILLAFFLIIGMVILAPPIIFVFSSTYLVRIHESLGVMQSLERARSMMKDNFWWTWLIMVCAYLIVMVLSLVFSIPQMFLQFMVMFNSAKGIEGSTLETVFMVVSSVGTFGTSMLYAIYIVITTLHYFSLVEKKEGVGLFARIDDIGKKEPDHFETSY